MDSYIGNRPLNQAAGFRHEVYATAGQTAFAVTYAPGYLDVFLNGVKLGAEDFTATDGATVTLASGASAGALVAFIAWAKGTMAPVTDFAPITRPRKNILINGGFDLWRRGSGPFTTGYSADRWKVMSTAASAIQPGGGLYGKSASSAYISHSSATNSLGIQQSLELSDARRLQGKRVTFSVYAYTTTGTASLNLIARISSTANDSTASFSNLTPISGTGSFTVTTTTTRFSITVDFPNNGTAEGIGFYLGVINGPNGGGTALLNAQVEIGAEATDFDVRPVREEAAMAERFYTSSGTYGRLLFSGDVTAGGGYYATRTFGVRMRVFPTIVATNSTASLFSASVGTVNGDAQGIQEGRSASGTGVGLFATTWTADAEL